MNEDPSNAPIVAPQILQQLRALQAKPGSACSDSTLRVLLDAATDQQPKLERWCRQSRRRASSGSVENEARLRFVEHLLASFDHEGYRQIQRRLLTPESIDAQRGMLKYLNLAYWLRAKLELALELGLHRTQPLAILDLGVGPGHFPFVCRHFGHEVIGADVEPQCHLPDWKGQHVYDVLLALFEIDKIPLRIEPQQQLPDLGRRFDLVTALMIKFDHPRVEIHWTASDWVFFLHDLATRHVAQDGRVFLTLNRPSVTPEILRAMLDRGAAVDERKCTVRFDSVKGLR
jgi:hypothetical protein